MENGLDLLEPLKFYNETDIKERHEENVTNFFDDLVSKSSVNIEENKETCKKYYSSVNKIKKLTKEISKYKTLFGLFLGFGIFSIVVAFICFIFLLDIRVESHVLPVTLGVVFGLLIGIALILVACLVFNKKRKKLKSIIDVEKKTSESLKLEAFKQMATLNNLFTWSIPSELLEKSIPEFKMDEYFDTKNLYNLVNEYGYEEDKEVNRSTIYVQSGSLFGSPFLIKNDLVQTMGKCTYTGHLVIHWTTTYTDKNGVHTEHHTQTLTATIERDKPYYNHQTKLIYANEGAPNLTFSRTSTHSEKLDDKKREKYVKEFYKKLDKKAEKAVGNSNFTALANTEFEAFFNALNRNNEVEFRLMFTPLAQRNLVKLLRESPYGDDFSYIKKQKINTIMSSHSQSINYDTNPIRFIHFDYEECRRSFIKQNMDYLKGLYFDFAPLLSIPLYQTVKPIREIKSYNSQTNITQYETEVLANRYPRDVFKHEETATDVILKPEFINKDKDMDSVNIHAHSFKGIQHIALVPRMGGDGHLHEVPVEWTEYIPIEEVTPIYVGRLDNSNENINDNINKNISSNNFLKENIQNNGIIYERGLISYLLKRIVKKEK